MRNLQDWSSPYANSEYEHNSLKTDITETSETQTTEHSDENEKCKAVAIYIRCTP